MKNYLPGFAALAIFAALMVAGPVMAQDSATTGGQSGQSSSGSGMSSTGSTYANTQQDNGTSKWPLLGLLGLAGLAGLRRPAQVTVRQDKNSTARAY